jgi:hypothetical protein
MSALAPAFNDLIDSYEADLNKQKLAAEAALQLVEDALGALGVRKNFRHNDRTNDFVGSEDDENAIYGAADDLAKAVELLKPIAGYL